MESMAKINLQSDFHLTVHSGALISLNHLKSFKNTSVLMQDLYLWVGNLISYSKRLLINIQYIQ